MLKKIIKKLGRKKALILWLMNSESETFRSLEVKTPR